MPEEAGLLLPIIKRYAPTKSILGVCLGHQAIGEAFGARLENLKEVYHGVQTPITILHQDLLFEGLGKEIPVGRYHSWVVSREGFPDCLEITAESQEGQIMAIRHKTYNVHGIQFHPESVLTPQGKEIYSNTPSVISAIRMAWCALQTEQADPKRSDPFAHRKRFGT